MSLISTYRQQRVIAPITVTNPQLLLVVSDAMVTDTEDYIDFKQSQRGGGDAFDAQGTLVFDPGTSSISGDIGNQPLLIPMPSWQNNTYGLKVDFGGYREPTEKVVFRLSHVGYWDGTGAPVHKLYTSNDGFHWTERADLPTDSFNNWRVVELETPVDCRYAKVEATGPLTHEIAYIGEYRQGTSAIITPPAIQPGPEQTSLDQFIGVDSFIDVPGSRDGIFKAIRLYTNNRNLVGDIVEHSAPQWPNWRYRFAPSWSVVFNFDEKLQEYRDNGVTNICLNLKETLDYFEDPASTNTPGEHVFMDQSTGLTDAQKMEPIRYLPIAEVNTYAAARYGTKADHVVADFPKIDTANGEIHRFGLNLIDEIEPLNEQDQTWRHRQHYMKPQEMALLISCVYDGHEGVLGEKIGVKWASNDTLKLRTPGLAFDRRGYFDEIVEWLKIYRTDNAVGLLTKLVKSFHPYVNTAGGQGGIDNQDTGISPEQDGRRAYFEGMIELHRRRYPQIRVQVGEFGYDKATTLSRQRALPVINGDVPLTAAAWSIRDWIIGYIAGVDIKEMFMIRDSSSANTVYSTSGVTGRKQVYFRHPLFYFINTLVTHSVGFKARDAAWNNLFTEIVWNNEGLNVFRLIDPLDNTKSLYILWMGTSTDAVTNNYVLNLDPAINSAYEVKLVDKEMTGLTRAITISSNTYTLNVTEVPTLIVGSTNAEVLPSAPTGLYAEIKTTEVVLTWEKASFNQLNYVIERQEGAGAFSIIATITDGTRTYTDNTVVGNTQYGYRVKTTNSAGDSEYSSVFTLTTARIGLTLTDTIRINYRSSSNPELDEPGWAASAGNQTNGYTDTNIQSSGIDMTVSGFFSSQTNGRSSDGVDFPDNVLKGHFQFFDSNTPSLVFTIPDDSFYTFRFMFSRDFDSEPHEVRVSHGEGTAIAEVDGYYNATKEAVLHHLQRDGSNTITIDFTALTPGEDGTLSGLIIERYV